MRRITIRSRYRFMKKRREITIEVHDDWLAFCDHDRHVTGIIHRPHFGDQTDKKIEKEFWTCYDLMDYQYPETSEEMDAIWRVSVRDA